MGNASGRQGVLGSNSGDRGVHTGVINDVIGSPDFGSPLQYGMQGNMEPIIHSSHSSFTMGPTEYAGWSMHPKMVPTILVWPHGGTNVEIKGSWNNWTTLTKLQANHKDFTIVQLLAPGVYQYKFQVDDEWRHDPNRPAVYDDDGNINNVLEVQEYAPENITNLQGFEPPPSPRESYGEGEQTTDEDTQKDPPKLPPHLNLTLLNVPAVMNPSAALPRPSHVVLNHIYYRRGNQNVKGSVIGSTHRYKSKYITTIMYKPTKEHNMQNQILHPEKK
eukprot:TRINITY_DN6197_c0_g1_i7.p1 TRINITY_DN6197_c0_g1~~TRINITY_DN6197_c0_g1_i7.p1  ORF type:complete len:275 (-),score=42.51 TRINITY_DN6197_c0_g1_i7:330-1154(-)